MTPTTSRPSRLRTVLLSASALLVVLPVAATSSSVSAGGGYSFDSARDCSAIFGSSSWCIDANGNGRFEEAEQYSPAGFGYRNCTDYVAYRIRAAGLAFTNTMNGGRFGNASNWDDNARALGWTVSTTARPKAIAVSNGGKWGHVAWVESVNADGSVNVSEYNYSAPGSYGTRSNVRFDAYVYVPGVTTTPAPATSSLSKYANTIVKVQGDSVTSWYVSPDLKRMWIPDGGTYNQLKSRGVAGPYTLPATTINQLPDQRNQWVASGAVWTGNRALRRGMSVFSTDGRYRFTMQTDGNLVLYGPSGRALWATSSKTGSWRAQEFVIFQSDGNLVTYGGGRAIWWSGAAGTGSRFVVQSDGNLVIYASSGRVVWASGTNGKT